MKAMILAAGRGSRMRELCDHMPKPLLPVHGKPLIVHHLLALKKIGVTEIVINVCYLADKIQQTLGDGQHYGVKIHYSIEKIALETGGGIYQALSFLGKESFISLNGDIWTDYPLQQLPQKITTLAHLILVNNPHYKINGDMNLREGFISLETELPYTYSGIAVFHPDLFKNCQPGIFPLIHLFKPAIAEKKISGELYNGIWIDVGTPERYQQLNS